MSERKDVVNISNNDEVVEDCEKVAQIAHKYGYDILCDDAAPNSEEMRRTSQTTDDPNCDKAIRALSRFGYEVVCE